MTEIFGTLGPSCMNEETLGLMFSEGMTGIRLNLSHMMLKSHEKELAMIRRAAAKCGITPKILIDLMGPELRIGDLTHPIELAKGDKIRLCLRAGEGKGEVAVSDKILAMLLPGQEILLDDGKILAKIVTKEEESACAVIRRGGILSSRKSIAVEGGVNPLPALTPKDVINIRAAVSLGITGVMQPFVRGKEDLDEVRSALKEAGGEHIRIYAKIENLRGLEKLDELIDFCDEIVIARGDLGNAVPLWELPRVQKKIAARCVAAGRDFMVVTQMLASMEHAAVPTRAEVSDIYNAVCDGATSVMVTGETAVGEYPDAVIRYLKMTAASFH